MTGWAIAAVLYALPVLAGVRHFDEAVEDCRDWMRSDEGEWFPALAPIMAVISLLLWPLFAAIDAISPPDPSQ